MIIDFAEDYDRDPHNPYIAEKAAMCKLFSIEAVKKVSDEMLEIFGGDGYFEDSPYGPTERLYRDCRALWLEEGSPTIQRITIARELERQTRAGAEDYADEVFGHVEQSLDTLLNNTRRCRDRLNAAR